MSCGCGKYNERHKDGDITLDDMQRAAQNANIDVEKAADNIHEAARQVRQSGRAS
jgi:hypothetical protein